MPNKRQSMGNGIERIINDPKFAGKIILKDMLPFKMSAIIIDFAKPLLEKIDLSNERVSNKRAAEKAIQKAVEIWNNTIVMDRACGKAGEVDNRLYRLAMAQIVKQKLSFRISEKDYKALLERKEALYPNNNFFIIEHNVTWSDNDEQLHLSVVTGDADNVK